MKKTLIVSLLLVALAGITSLTLGGDLEPPGPPAPTMKTLHEVEPRVPITVVPFTITQSGSYYLAGDLTSVGDGIVVEADNVTIDLMGHSLVGPGAGVTYGVYMNGRSNVEIRNGTIRDFGQSGVYEASATSGSGHRATGIRALSHGNDGINLRGKNSVIEDCVAIGNGNRGLSVANAGSIIASTARENGDVGIIASGSGSLVSNNVAYDNRSNGISASWGTTVVDNVSYNNDFAGISVSNACTVTNNTLLNNGNSGIYAVDGCMIYHNTVTGNNLNDAANHGGIRVNNGCLVKSNTSRDNRLYNIFVVGTNSALEENLVAGSTNGIYFDSAGNFYADNRATDNTTDYAGSVPTGSGDGGGNASF